MCRHCERITDHVEDKPVVHAFMEQAARRISELDGEPVSADDLYVVIERTKVEWVPNPLYETDARKRLLSILGEMDR